MADGTGLANFRKEFPDRFFDAAIAEQHALTMGAGLAREGMKPVIPIYSSFYQRGYDQVIHDICLQKLPVVLCVDRAGIVGNDGETHQGIYDLSFLNIVPNLTIMAPKDFQELEQMLEFALTLNAPVAIRYPRGGESDIKFETHKKIELGKAEKVIKFDKEIKNKMTILAIGKMVARAVEVSKELKKYKINAEVINVRFLKPIDEKYILKSIKETKNVITIEDNIIKGGLGSTISEIITKNNLNDVKLKCFGYPDEFIKHGSVDEIEKIYGLDVQSIVNCCKAEE